MSKIKKIISVLSLGIFAFTAVGCNMIERTPESIRNTVVAKVGDEKITKGELDDSLKHVLDPLREKYGDKFEEEPSLKEGLKQEREQQLQALVDEKIALYKAKELELIPTEEEMTKEIDDRVKFYKELYGEKFAEQIKSFGYETEEDFRVFIKDQVVVSKVLDYIYKDITVSEEEAKAFYDENVKEFTKQPGAEVAHILVEVKDFNNADEVAKAEAKIKDARNRIVNKGEDFAKVAKEVSQDPGSKDNGGSYGYTAYEGANFVEEFLTVFKNGTEGQISEPFRTKFGYHIVKTTGVIKEAKVTTFDEVKKDLMTGTVTLANGKKYSMLDQKKNSKLSTTLEEWRKEYNVKMYKDKL